MIVDRASFGRLLRQERERRNIPLPAIAAATKIRLTLLVALERGDFSVWPSGLCRRDFFRQYLAAIGLPAEPLVAQFLRLFRANESEVEDLALEATLEETSGPRLALATDRLARRPLAARALSGVLAWGVAFLLAGLVVRALYGNAWMAAALLASIYTAAALVLGRTRGGSWTGAARWWLRGGWRHAPIARAVRQLVQHRSSRPALAPQDAKS
jgi:hypothetical protein